MICDHSFTLAIRIMTLGTDDLDSLLHPVTNFKLLRSRGPLIIASGRGIYVYDDDGNEYIEGMAGLWCTALGYGVPELADAAHEQISRLAYSPLFAGKSHEPAIRLAQKLKAWAPGVAGKVFFGSTGSDANDTQIKLIRYYNNALGRPRKKKIISRLRGYHGVTIASASLTGLAVNHAMFDLPMPGILHVECPHHYRGAEPGETEEEFATRLAASLEARILQEDPDTVAAFIAEPLMGAGGVIVPPRTYFEKVQAVLERLRHPADRRRGHLRIRPHRVQVRRGVLRDAARHDVGGEGDLIRLRAAQRRAHSR